MFTRAAMLDSNGPVAAEMVPPKPTAIRFLYPSGSKPLNGFVIKRGIGRGGFGEVYFATSDAGKEVALKHIERNLEVELRGVSQCLNLKHVNLIDLYDVRFDEQGDAWVVMEYVTGASLKETIDRNPNGLPLDQVEFWFRGIAAGVSYLHDHGIVHRDLKPANIFQDDDCVKIGDYGLSKFISASRRSGQTESVGTFHYMAPEIGKGAYGKEIDIYALGIILFEMLTGKLPFDGESSQEIIMKHLTADPDLSGVQQPYRSVIEFALRKDPEKRFHNASDMVAALTHPPAAGGYAAGTGFASANPASVSSPTDGITFGPLQDASANATARVAGQPSPRSAEEPIARAISDAMRRFSHWWHHGPLTTGGKVAIVLAAIFLGLVQSEWLVPAAVVLTSLYLVYFGVRTLVHVASTPSSLPQQRASVPHTTHYRPAPMPLPRAIEPAPVTLPPRFTGWHKTVNYEEQDRQLLRQKTGSDRIGELTGSMLWAAIIAAVLSVVMTTIGGDAIDDSANPLAGPVWLWLCSTLGSWLVLAAGKLCERQTGEVVKRRFAMLVLGLAFGAVAFYSSDFLMVKFHDGIIARGLPTRDLTRGMFDEHGAPNLAAFLAYFGAVFLTLRWWKQSDSLRSSRLRISAVVASAVVAGLWQLMWPFPQPWGVMLVAAISITTQLSAPWLNPAERTAALERNKTHFA